MKKPVNGVKLNGVKLNGHHAELNRVISVISIPCHTDQRLAPLSNFQLAETPEELPSASCDNGFEATLQACRKMGLDLSAVPPSILQIFYTSGVCFGPSDLMTVAARSLWRNSVVWPAQREQLAKEPVQAIFQMIPQTRKTPNEK